jgi:hypothetical protein
MGLRDIEEAMEGSWHEWYITGGKEYIDNVRITGHNNAIEAAQKEVEKFFSELTFNPTPEYAAQYLKEKLEKLRKDLVCHT